MRESHDITTAIVAIMTLLISKGTSLRLVMLDVPSPTVVGESVELTCSFDLENQKLYAVKWYKNDAEFYRYVPTNYPPTHYLPMPGIRVDVSRSNEHYVYLRHIDLNTAGKYRCEVSADAPYFDSADASKEMNVLVLPTEGPKIAGGRQRYQVGETVSLNCTSVKSKPAAILKWFINDEPAGSEYEKEYSTTLHADGLETSSLTLRFVVTEKHFRRGNMRLKCTATISRLYTMSDEEHALLGKRQTSGFQIDEGMWQTRDRAAAGVESVHVAKTGATALNSRLITLLVICFLTRLWN